jgi:hypothetical protein
VKISEGNSGEVIICTRNEPMIAPESASLQPRVSQQPRPREELEYAETWSLPVGRLSCSSGLKLLITLRFWHQRRYPMMNLPSIKKRRSTILKLKRQFELTTCQPLCPDPYVVVCSPR